MLLRRKWSPLLLIGLCVSSLLALYFLKVDNGGNSIFEHTSCKRATILSKENGKLDLLFFQLAKGIRLVLKILKALGHVF